jgi:hypothetical protein
VSTLGTCGKKIGKCDTRPLDQSDGARAQKKLDFGLTKRALKFARLYAENPYGTSKDRFFVSLSRAGNDGVKESRCEIVYR